MKRIGGMALGLLAVLTMTTAGAVPEDASAAGLTACDAAHPSECLPAAVTRAEGIAFHEAAHAVIAHECGFEISSVSAAQTHGLVEFAYPKDPDAATSDCVIQTYLAGSSVWNDRRGAGSRQDLKLAREQAERAVDEGLADGDPADVYARNLGAVQDKLLRHWDKVESLARNITLLPAPVTLDGESAVAMFDMVPRT